MIENIQKELEDLKLTKKTSETSSSDVSESSKSSKTSSLNPEVIFSVKLMEFIYLRKKIFISDFGFTYKS